MEKKFLDVQTKSYYCNPMKLKNVLSLFDGCSGAQQSLERAGITFDNYYASEVDKYAIAVTQRMYPNTIQLGDVRNVDANQLPPIEILFAGSPCQSFFFAGKRNGMSTKCSIEITTLEHYLELKAENFEFEGQSYLFWEFMRILKEVKPKYFLLENVMMGEKWEKILSRAVGYNPIVINSALVSGQNRVRNYWTNIGTEPDGFFGYPKSIIQQPADRGIMLKDVLEENPDKKYYLSAKAIDHINRDKQNLGFQMDEDDDKSKCITAVFSKQIPYNQIVVHSTMGRTSTSGKGGTGPLSRADGKTYCLDTSNSIAVEIFNNKRLNNTLDKHREDLESGTLIDSYNEAIHKDKSITISTRVQASNCTHIYQPQCVAMRGRYDKDGNIKQQLEPNHTGKTNTLTSVQKDNLILGADFRVDEGLRIRKNGKSGTLAARARNDESCGQLAVINSTIRRLTERECARLQTISEENIDKMLDAKVSSSQIYKMLGNGWNIETIAHILTYLK
jgi:DNA-cytosine methyltransferase